MSFFFKGDLGGSVVLIGQDGIQLPPLTFPSSGSLLSFLTCLEQGLHPDGRLDPPLFNKSDPTIDWPKLKKTVLPDKLIQALEDGEEKKDEYQDYVFRLVLGASTSNLGEMISYDIQISAGQSCICSWLSSFA